MTPPPCDPSPIAADVDANKVEEVAGVDSLLLHGVQAPMLSSPEVKEIPWVCVTVFPIFW